MMLFFLWCAFTIAATQLHIFNDTPQLIKVAIVIKTEQNHPTLLHINSQPQLHLKTIEAGRDYIFSTNALNQGIATLTIYYDQGIADRQRFKKMFDNFGHTYDHNKPYHLWELYLIDLQKAALSAREILHVLPQGRYRINNGPKLLAAKTQDRIFPLDFGYELFPDYEIFN